MKKNKTILPPTYLFIYLVIEIIIHFLLPVKRIIPSPINLIGILMIVFGVLLNLWADRMFTKKKTTVKPFEKPSSLLTEGPFCFSRHPMYLGFILILFGLAVLLGSITSFLPPIMMFLTLETKFIPYEEKNLEETFGKSYWDYKKKVRPWI